MNIFVAGMNHKTAPINLREKYAFREDELKESLNNVKNLEGILECLILSTCNRVEIYFLTVGEDGQPVIKFMHERSGLPAELIQNMGEIIYIYKNEKAVEHVCRVSAGLDSMVMGEPQIFGQIKEAYNLAAEAGAAGPVFRSLFKQVFSLVKKIRSSTEIGRSNLSVSHIAVSLARKLFNDLRLCNVLVVGAGEMAELTVQALKNHGAKRVFVTNRTFERAVNLARALDGTPIMLYELYEYLPSVDIVICSISADKYFINKSDIENLILSKGQKPFIIIDISVPRSINPDVSELEKVYLYNIDDLRSIAEANLSSRIAEAEKVQAIIREKAPRILRNLDTDKTIADIVEIRKSAEEIRRSELEKLLAAIEMPEAYRNRIEAFSRSVVNKILHKALEKMREHSGRMNFK